LGDKTLVPLPKAPVPPLAELEDAGTTSPCGCSLISATPKPGRARAIVELLRALQRR
jgi:hypothetical protein